MAVKDISIAVISVTVIFLVFSGAILFFFLWYQKKKELDKKRMLEIELKSEQLNIHFQQQLLQTQLEIQEQTLKNISQEIHDNVGQVLSLAKLNLNMMDTRKPELLQGKIDSALHQVTKAINDLRNLSKSFNSDNIIDQGLIKAIAAELEMIHKSGSHHTEFRVTGQSNTLEPQKELILFRIVQEALHNIIKHAGATTVRVRAEYTPELLQLSVTDNGHGFDLTPLNHSGNTNFGLGIRNMHSRAKMIGAEFSISSTQGTGTVVSIRLPV